MTNGKWKTENIPYAHSPLGFRLFGHLPGLLFDERRAGDQVAARGVDQLDALGAASGGANLFGFEADQFAVAGDDQHFAVFGDRHDGDHLAVLLGGLNVDHAFAAARLHAVFRERRLLAETVAGDAQHLLVAVHRDDADHVIVVAPSVSSTVISSSPSLTPIAMMPFCRMLPNSESSVFLITPLRVTITAYWPSANSRTGITPAIFSLDGRLIRLTMALPLPAAVASGISWTFSL